MGLDATEHKAGKVWFWVSLALAGAVCLTILLSTNAPLLQDYPDWVLQGVLFAKVLRHQPVAGYALHHYPVPNSLTTVGIGLLTLIMPWVWAAKLWLAGVTGLLFYAGARLLKRFGGGNGALLPLFTAAVVLGIDFWDGSINFQLGVALLLLWLDHTLRQRPGRLSAALLVLIFFTHMLPCSAALLVLLLLAVQQWSLRPLLPAVPTVFLAAWYSLARDKVPSHDAAWHLLPALFAVGIILAVYARAQFRGQRVTAPELRSAALAVPLPLVTYMLHTKAVSLLGFCGPYYVVPATALPHRVLWQPTLFAAVTDISAVTAALLLALLVRQAVRVQRGGTDEVLAVAALCLGVLFLLLPLDALGVTAIDNRMLHLALVLALVLAARSRSRMLPWLAGLVTLLCCCNLYQFLAVQRDPQTMSLAHGAPIPATAGYVAPAVREGYYEHLWQGRYVDAIFPTALFRQP